MIIGYTTGVFDLFHIGHLNIIKQSKKKCDYLIVGVTSDKLVLKIKKKYPIIPYSERSKIISSLRYVDKVVEEKIDDKILAWKKLKYNIVFKGSDHKNSEKWKKWKPELKGFGVKVKFIKYTEDTSSTLILSVLNKIYK